MNGRVFSRLVAVVMLVALVVMTDCSGTSARQRVVHSPRPFSAEKMDSVWKARSIESIGMVYEQVEAW